MNLWSKFRGEIIGWTMLFLAVFLGWLTGYFSLLTFMTLVKLFVSVLGCCFVIAFINDYIKKIRKNK